MHAVRGLDCSSSAPRSLGEYQRIGFYRNKVAFDLAGMSKTGRITSQNSDSHFVRVEADADGKEKYFINLV